VLPPGGKFVCQVQQEVSQPEFDAADVYAAYTVSVGVSGVATPLGNNSSEVTSGDAEAVALAPAVVPGISITATSASPTTVTTAGERRGPQQAVLPYQQLGLLCAVQSALQ
jgi:hypothetical protein